MGLTLMFLSGYLRNCRLIGKKFSRGMIVLYVVSLIPVCLLVYGSGVSKTDDPYRWMMAYLAGLGLFLLFERLQDATRVAVFLGSISYSVYLLHSASGHARALFFSSQHSLLGAAFVIAVTIPASWIVYRVVELQGQQLGKRIIKRISSKPHVVTVP